MLRLQNKGDSIRALVLNKQPDRQFALSLPCPDNHLDSCGDRSIVEIISGKGCRDIGAAPECVGGTECNDNDRSCCRYAEPLDECCLFIVYDSGDNDIGISRLQDQLW